jgi:hypothetical protein
MNLAAKKMVRSASFRSTSSKRTINEKRSHVSCGDPSEIRSGGKGGGRDGRVQTWGQTTSLVVCQLSRVNRRATDFSNATFFTNIDPRSVGGRVQGKTSVSTWTLENTVGSITGTVEDCSVSISRPNCCEDGGEPLLFAARIAAFAGES